MALFLELMMTVLKPDTIFSITSEKDFESAALRIFRFQYEYNSVYRDFCRHLKKSPSNIAQSNEIPFLPISFFKSHKVLASAKKTEITFSSSGTTGMATSKHHLTELKIYEQSFMGAFHRFYGQPKDYCILALLPSYLEREGSSLVYMVQQLIEASGNADSGFYLYDFQSLHQKLLQLEQKNRPSLLIGVSFALLDFVEQHPIRLKNCTVMETGGMKGRRKELIREELHALLKEGFGIEKIHSEYGMTELLSQAYSKGDGRFTTPPWMKVLIRDPEDPLQLQKQGKNGGINVIDLANINSCSFIATQDLGRVYQDGSFEILGRFDHADVRGCNLMVL